jgi:hypothetical protein
VVKRGVTVKLPEGSAGVISSYVHGRVGVNATDISANVQVYLLMLTQEVVAHSLIRYSS